MNQNFLKLDQNMQKMLQRKSSDKKRMTNILAAVHQGLERDESFENKVREVSLFAKKKNKKEQAQNLKTSNLSMYEVRLPAFKSTVGRYWTIRARRRSSSRASRKSPSRPAARAPCTSPSTRATRSA